MTAAQVDPPVQVDPAEIEALDDLAQWATLDGWRHIIIRRGLARDGQWFTITSCGAWPDALLWRPGRVVAIWATARTLDPVRQATAASLTAAGVEVLTWCPADGLDAVLAALDGQVAR